jgi:hypothetical protein
MKFNPRFVSFTACLQAGTVDCAECEQVIPKRSVRVLDRLCGLAVRVLGYRSGGPGSIPGTIRKEM